MKTGRPHKPTYLKLVDPRSRVRRPSLSDEPQPRAELPEPPAELSADAKIEWERVSEQLFRAGLLTVLDRGILTAYCQCFARWMIAERALAEMAKRDQFTSGLTIRNASGDTVQNPLVGTAARALRLTMHFGNQLGISTVPALARGRLTDPHGA
jgi:P27 family predicted phage terminase small subunit